MNLLYKMKIQVRNKVRTGSIAKGQCLQLLIISQLKDQHLKS